MIVWQGCWYLGKRHGKALEQSKKGIFIVEFEGNKRIRQQQYVPGGDDDFERLLAKVRAAVERGKSCGMLYPPAPSSCSIAMPPPPSLALVGYVYPFCCTLILILIPLLLLLILFLPLLPYLLSRLKHMQARLLNVLSNESFSQGRGERRPILCKICCLVNA